MSVLIGMCCSKRIQAARSSVVKDDDKPSRCTVVFMSTTRGSIFMIQFRVKL